MDMQYGQQYISSKITFQRPKMALKNLPQELKSNFYFSVQADNGEQTSMKNLFSKS